MQILDELRHDHESLRAEMSALEEGRSTPERLARFVRDLENHAHREDELLFGALEPYLPTDHGPLQAMRAEHADIERLLERLTLDDPPGVTRLCTLARDHFQKEEQVLFVFAARLLDPSRLAMLGAKLRATAPSCACDHLAH